jgi:hypothetical protein
VYVSRVRDMRRLARPFEESKMKSPGCLDSQYGDLGCLHDPRSRQRLAMRGF